MLSAEIAQLGERQTEDLKVPGSIPGLGTTIKILFCAGVREWKKRGHAVGESAKNGQWARWQMEGVMMVKYVEEEDVKRASLV